MTPYRIRSRSVSVRRRCGPEFVVVSLPKPLSFLLRNYSRNFKTAIRVYSRNRALFLPCATPPGPCIQSFQSKQSAQLSSSAQYRTSALPHFLSHSLSCTFVQVAKSSGGVLYFTHGMILP